MMAHVDYGNDGLVFGLLAATAAFMAGLTIGIMIRQQTPQLGPVDPCRTTPPPKETGPTIT